MTLRRDRYRVIGNDVYDPEGTGSKRTVGVVVGIVYTTVLTVKDFKSVTSSPY